MGNAIFPHISGLGWTVTKTSTHKNLTQSAAAPGFETRINLGPDPIYKFDLEYVILRSDGVKSLKQLEGFFNLRKGDFESFLIDLSALTKNAADASVTGQVLTPDGSGYAPLIARSTVSDTENYDENLYELKSAKLYMGGTEMVLNTDYTIQGPGVALSGVSYPGLVAHITKEITGTVTADLSWYYRVKFAQSEQELEQFLYLLWRAKSVQLVGTRT